MEDLLNLTEGLFYLAGTIVLIRILVFVIAIYMIITVWLNIKHTRLNTEKIVQLLTDMHHRNNSDSPGLGTQEENNNNSNAHTSNEPTIEKNINSYEGWWFKYNPPARQPLPKNMNVDETTTDPSEAVNNLGENGDENEADFDIVPNEKWWNRKIF